jgi:RNA-directed DNA polymerase
VKNFRRNQQMKTRPFSIPKQAVWEAYKGVKANRGSAGVDEVSLEAFDKDLSNNLYKLWARLCSGSYMPPPVKLVEIPKKDGGKRPLGIPTVSDRIAQMVVKRALEPEIDKVFYADSYGYRPGKSALEAVGKARERCWQYDWVLDLDIKGFFDNIPHDLLMKAVERHTSCKWHLLYIKRWLEAPVQQPDGQQVSRSKGTPQGAVISPLLANLFLHYCMDSWLKRHYPQCPFERYADDAIIHCRTESEAQELKEGLGKRLEACGLEMHPEKTKIVYCKDSNRRGNHASITFDFLGYGFQPRPSRNKAGRMFVGFTPAISAKSRKSINEKVSECKSLNRTDSELQEIAKELNPRLRGWINYYGKYCKSALTQTLNNVTIRIARWAKRKYKKLHDSITEALKWVETVRKNQPGLFAHWKRQ